jgi:hypothetical protein
VLGLLGQQRLHHHVRVEHHRTGWLPVRGVEGKHAAQQRRTTRGAITQYSWPGWIESMTAVVLMRVAARLIASARFFGSC